MISFVLQEGNIELGCEKPPGVRELGWGLLESLGLTQGCGGERELVWGLAIGSAGGADSPWSTRMWEPWGAWVGLSNRGGWDPFWGWGQQDLSSLRGLLAPKMRCGHSGWASASGLGEESRLEMLLESSQEEERPGGVRGYSRPCTGTAVLLELTQSPKGWLSGAQLHFLIPL